MKPKHFKIASGLTLALLLIPWIAMQFTKEVQWRLTDFLVAGIFIYTASLLIQWLAVNIKPLLHRILLIAFCMLISLLIWAEMAVGILGTPLAGS